MSRTPTYKTLLPRIMATVTRAPRYFPDAEKSDSSAVFNLFRAYERLFGRRAGIRPESTVSCTIGRDGKMVARTRFHTLEAFLVHVECEVNRFASIASRRLAGYGREHFSPAEWDLAISMSRGAIAFDAVGGGANTGSGSSLSWSHTCAGSSRKLFGGGWSQTTNGASNADYNGSGLTFIDGATQAGCRFGLWYLDAPATGSNTLTWNFSGAGQTGWGYSTSYSGCATGIDNHAANNGAGSSNSVALTPVADNCWIVVGWGCGNNQTMNATNSSVTRGNGNNGNGACAIGDTNAAIHPAASTTMGYSWSTGGNNAGAIASFAPAVAANQGGMMFAFF